MIFHASSPVRRRFSRLAAQEGWPENLMLVHLDHYLRKGVAAHEALSEVYVLAREACQRGQSVILYGICPEGDYAELNPELWKELRENRCAEFLRAPLSDKKVIQGVLKLLTS